MRATTVDELLLKFGDPGKYQIRTYCLLLLAICTTAFSNFIGLFVVGYYPHRCKLPEGWLWPVNESIPLNEDGELDSCSMYKNADNHSEGTTTCLFGWEYQTPGPQWTIVQEWDLVCTRRHLGAVSISLYYGGVMCGCMVFGFLADKIGRKPVILTALYIHIFVAIAISYSSSFTMYIALRMVDGACLQGVAGTSIVMSVEIFQPHHRNIVAIANQAVWPFMLCVDAALSYIVGYWRTLHLISGVPTVITIVYIWWFPESVRWLLVFHKLPQARATLTRMARLNKVPMPTDIDEDLKTVAENITAAKKSSEYDIKELFKTKKMRQVILSACYSWPASSLVYWGISYTMPKFGSSNHINFLISSSIEFSLTVFVMYWMMQRFGRRFLCMVIMSFCAIMNVLAAILRNTLPREEGWTTIILGVVAIGGRLCMSTFYTCMPMFFRELYPTSIRNMANGAAQICGRPATMMAPYLILLEQDVWKPLPFLIFSVLCCGNVLLIFLLPETLNKPLPEIPEDLDKLWAAREPGTRKWRYGSVKGKEKTEEQKEENVESQGLKQIVADVEDFD